MTFFVVLKRELSALIALPQTYAIAAAYLLLSGIFFVNLLTSSQVPDLGSYYSNVASTLIVLCPIVAMRSFAEERKSGALDLTLSWPISRVGLVLGKYAANTLFVWSLICVSWLYVRLISSIASISIARAGGGFLGMLLLAAAFNALTLMVASRASSPTGAAFLGFGLLLFLWILDYAPTFIQNSLSELGPTTHFEPFPRGVLYAEDVGYFLIVVVAGIAVSVQALGKQSPGKAVGSLVRRSAGLVVAVVVVGLALSVTQSLDGQVDLTSDNRNTVTEATKVVLARLDGAPVRLIGFVEPISTEASQIRSVVRQYRAAGANIRAEIIDPDVQPGKARAFGVRDYKQYRLELNGRFEVMDSLDQVPLTSAMSRLSRSAKPVACFIAGHGERSVADEGPAGLRTFGAEVRKLGFTTAALTLDPADGAKNLKRCDVVSVMGPTAPIPDADLALLDAYAKANGRIVVMADGAAPADVRAQLNRLLEPWGVGFLDGVIADKSALAGQPASVVSFDYPSGSPVTASNSADSLPVVMYNALPVEKTLGEEDEGHVTNLVRSSRASTTVGLSGKTENGPFSLGVISDFSRVLGEDRDNPDNVAALRSVRTRVGVVGSVDMASNSWFRTLGNADFSTGLVQWVGREDDIISASGKTSGLYKISISKTQRNGLIRKGIVLPTLAALIPVPVALFRLKRG